MPQPSDPHISDQPIHVSETVVFEETIPVVPENIISEQQQQQQTQKQSDNSESTENIVSDPTPQQPKKPSTPPKEQTPEITPSQPSSPLPPPVVEDYSSSNFVSETPRVNSPSPTPSSPNPYQIVPLDILNAKPIKTVHCLSSDSEPPSPTHSSTSSSSVSSFDEDNIVPKRVPRPRPFKPSEIHTSVEPSISGVKRPLSQPPKLIPSPPAMPATISKTISFLKANPQIKPNVGKLLSGFENEIQIWISFLKENCSNSQSPVEPEQLWSKFRKRFDTVASNIQDICCKDALKNLFESIKRRVIFLKDVPEHENYTGFVERCAATKAAERSFLNSVFNQIDADLNAALMSENKIVAVSEKSAEELVSEQPEDMQIDYVPLTSMLKSLDEIRREAEEMKNRQDAEKWEMKA